MVTTFFPGSIYGFNVGVSRSVQQGAAKRGIPLHLHSIIYKLIDGLKEELSAKLPSLSSRNILGEALYVFQMRRSHDLPVTWCLSHLIVAVQVKQRFWPCLTSQWGRKRFLWLAAVSRRVNWTVGTSSS